MKSGLTEIVVVLDASGSMEAKRSDAIGAFNAFLDEQLGIPGEAVLTLVTFNSPGQYRVVHAGTRLAAVPRLTRDTYVPGGMTALNDAVGRTIDEVGRRLAATPEPERPERVLFAILTDGEENSSSEYSLEQIRQRIELQRNVYSWQFIFLAAGLDAFQQATNMGILAQHAMVFEDTAHGVADAVSALSRRAVAFRTSGSVDDLPSGEETAPRQAKQKKDR